MNKARILIVEDEGVVARDLVLQLQELGYDPVAEASHGEEAVALAGKLQPDLVLMDVHLAGQMDGIAAAGAIRDQFGLPVVFLTAFTGDETLHRAKQAEPFGYIIKPFDERELRTAIEIAIYRHQSERKLRQSFEEQAAIIRSAMDGFVMSDRQGRITRVNDAYCRMTGFSAEELPQMTIAALWAGSTPESVEAKLTEIITNGSSLFERQHIRKDGQAIDVEISTAYLDDGGGRFVSFVRDITQRKRLESAVHDSELRFRSLLKGISAVAVQGYALDGTIHYWNEASTRIYGYSEAEAVGKSLLELLFTPESHDDYRQSMREMAATGRPIPPGEFTVCRKGESKITVFSSHAVVRVPGRPVELFCMDVDLTERKRMEMALRESQDDMQRAQAVAHVGSWKSSIQRDEILWSDETYQIFGVQPGTRITHEIFRSMVYPDDLELVNPARQQTSQGKPIEFRIVVGGRIKWVREQVELESDEQGQIIGGFGTVQDITERKEAEEAQAEAERFVRATIDALSSHLCVLDEQGTILTTNRAWEVFADNNPPLASKVTMGANYITVCDEVIGPETAEAIAFRGGIRSVLQGEREVFEMEYACHSPTEQRWFVGRVTRFPGAGPVRVVVTHENTTARKRAELQLTERLAELKRWQSVMLGREGRNLELKHEVNELLRRLGEPIRYPSQE